MNDSPSKDPSIFEEPHMKPDQCEVDPSEAKTDKVLSNEKKITFEEKEDIKVQRSVFDEPAFSKELAKDIPISDLTYDKWLIKRKSQTSLLKTWLVTFIVALLASPWAILGAFYSSGGTAFAILAMLTFGPLAEEIMKIALLLITVEKKPYLFRSPVQITLCALAGGIMFAIIENFMYLKVYIRDPSATLIAWRWSVCVILHSGCSVIAGLGVIRVWKDIWTRRAAPRLTLAYPYILTAVIIHGLYNAFAVVMHLLDMGF